MYDIVLEGNPYRCNKCKKKVSTYIVYVDTARRIGLQRAYCLNCALDIISYEKELLERLEEDIKKLKGIVND